MLRYRFTGPSTHHFDYVHEQCNKVIKCPINFVNQADENVQRRWEIAGTEITDYLDCAENPLRESNITTRIAQATTQCF